MANNLDLEEQEQLDSLKHFWRQYGNLISWGLILVMASFAGWNAYQYWQRSQAAQAAAMFDEVERMVITGDMVKVERAFTDMKEKFSGTSYAQQAGLMVAKVYLDTGKPADAKSALVWVSEKSSDEGYQSVAKLRLVGLLFESKSFDEALKLLSSPFPEEFKALVYDRRGDVYLAQGKRTEALQEYLAAAKLMDEQTQYRRLLDVKLASLGANPKQAASSTEGAK
jgi:predicted negative regulator of RcsB-dependent stress response